MFTYDELLTRFASWTERTHDVIAVFIIGSRARDKSPADAFSDLDLVLVVTDPEHFLSSDEWIENLSPYWMQFTERTFGGGQERRVLFEGALDVDFCLFSEAQFRRLATEREAHKIFSRGYRVMLDQAGLAGLLPNCSFEHSQSLPPLEGEFLNRVNDFWFHTVWVAKKLQRGELWTAKSCLDCYMKQHLLWITECHAHIINGWGYDTWHDGRFLDVWALREVKGAIPCTFARYDLVDMERALRATMDLFHSLAVKVAEDMQFEYPAEKEQQVIKWVDQALANLSPSDAAL